MKLFALKKERVADGLRVWVSQHVHYSEFGVRDSQSRHHSGRYVSMGTPGTGFFARESESDHYNRYVNNLIAGLKPKWWRYMLGLEFDYDKELDRVVYAMDHTDEELKHRILESYYNALTLSKEACRLENVIDGIKRKMHGRPRKAIISPLTHYKTRLQMREHDFRDLQQKVENSTDPERMRHYNEMVEVFKDVAQCHRIWNTQGEKGKLRLERVFWDTGIFDFIRSESGTPILRDGGGVSYYIYPEFMVVARSSVDFDVVDLREIHVVYRETTQESLVATVAHHEDSYGRSLGEVSFDGMGVRWFFMNRRKAYEFVEAFQRYMAVTKLEK